MLILEADQALTPELSTELVELFSRSQISERGFYVRRTQVFRGKRLRFGGYGSKYMLKLFYRTAGELDIEETDTRIYVNGPLGKLRAPIIEENLKEDAILFYLQKHLRYAEVFAREEAQRRRDAAPWKTTPAFFGNPDQRILWLKRVYFRMPLYVRPFIYFFYRYVILLGFLDGKQGSIFHFMQAFWFRLVLDIRLDEILKTSPAESSTPSDKAQEPAAHVAKAAGNSEFNL